jgi:predicted NUDIX family phosphoesterase
MEHPKEQVMVISKALAESLCNYAIFGPTSPVVEKIILDNHTFRDREEAETNLAFKQVIPYIVVRHQDNYLLSQRTKKQQEKRLHNLFSLGQGGHITPEDSACKDPILGGLMREIREEFRISPEYSCRPVGLINDDTNDVGKVHLGLVYMLMVSGSLLEVAEEGKHIARWANLSELESYYPNMETWSKIVMDHIIRARS